MTANEISADGLLQRLSANFAFKIAEFTFNTAENDSNGNANTAVGAHGVGVSLPANAIVCGGFVDVNTAFGTAAAGTLAISVEGADDIIAAAVVTGAPYSTIGRKAIVPKVNTPESTSVKTTVEREITCTVAVGALNAGKLTGYLLYITGQPSA